jgi:hypothetical protein
VERGRGFVGFAAIGADLRWSMIADRYGKLEARRDQRQKGLARMAIEPNQSCLVDVLERFNPGLDLRR